MNDRTYSFVLDVFTAYTLSHDILTHYLCICIYASNEPTYPPTCRRHQSQTFSTQAYCSGVVTRFHDAKILPSTAASYVIPAMIGVCRQNRTKLTRHNDLVVWNSRKSQNHMALNTRLPIPRQRQSNPVETITKMLGSLESPTQYLPVLATSCDRPIPFQSSASSGLPTIMHRESLDDTGCDGSY